MNSIIWDWNGTLLNDVELCISSINSLLKNRNLSQINTKKYKEVFSFPVKEYYKTLGFDFETEDFSVPAHQYIDLYYAGFGSCSLQENTIEVLTHFRKKGIRQFVLSAMEHEMLEETLKIKGIFHFFEGVAGLRDHYAVSKIDVGKQLILDFEIDRENTLMIGDTTHDFEVAQHLGVKCILIADGHQTPERLEKTGGIVIGSLQELVTWDNFEI
jgi:phosphoglycolate phosphatase